MKIIFLGTNILASSILEFLVKKKIKVNLVLTKPDNNFGRNLNLNSYPTKKISIKYSLNYKEINSINSESTEFFLKNYNPDLLIVVEYGEKINDNIIKIPKYGIFNIHPSILPSLRGSSPIEYTILKKLSISGVSIIHINDKIDEGNIVNLKIFYLKKNVSYDFILKKIVHISFKSLLEIFFSINKTNLFFFNQIGKISYTKKISKNFYKINWFDCAKNINSKIRSTQALKKHSTFLNNYFINVIETKIKKRLVKNFIPGTILKISNRGIYVSTKKNVIIIKKIQLSGKKINDIKDVLNSNNMLFKIYDFFI